MKRFYSHFDSPLGKILAAADENDALTDLHFIDGKYVPVLDTTWHADTQHATLVQTKRELTEYFNQKRTIFTLPLAPAGTAFQRSAWDALLTIPFGQTRSYGEQARLLGNPKASRAVGGANGKNPIAIVIPCHRVIGKSGSLTGYASGMDRKQFLLSLEGVA